MWRLSLGPRHHSPFVHLFLVLGVELRSWRVIAVISERITQDFVVLLPEFHVFGHLDDHFRPFASVLGVFLTVEQLICQVVLVDDSAGQQHGDRNAGPGQVAHVC